MNRRFVVRPSARQEIIEAAEWYAERNKETAARFAEAAERGLRAIEDAPFRYPIVYGAIRRFFMISFPYSFYYTVSDDEVAVLACLHGRRSPALWQGRE
jgi:plasmid stabilization system protein ParE